MNRAEVLRGLNAALERKIKSLLRQSDLGLTTYEELCAIDEDGARRVDETLAEMAGYIARLERDRQVLNEMLRREELR
jgi:hypothetical protein